MEEEDEGVESILVVLLFSSLVSLLLSSTVCSMVHQKWLLTKLVETSLLTGTAESSTCQDSTPFKQRHPATPCFPLGLTNKLRGEGGGKE